MFETKHIEDQESTRVYKSNKLRDEPSGMLRFPQPKRHILTRYQIRGLWVVRTGSRVTRMGLIFGSRPGISFVPSRCSISARYSSTSDRNSSPSSTVEEKIAQYNHSTKLSRFTKEGGMKLNHAEGARGSSELNGLVHLLTSSLRCSRVRTGCLAGYGDPSLRRFGTGGDDSRGYRPSEGDPSSVCKPKQRSRSLEERIRPTEMQNRACLSNIPQQGR